MSFNAHTLHTQKSLGFRKRRGSIKPLSVLMLSLFTTTTALAQASESVGSTSTFSLQPTVFTSMPYLAKPNYLQKNIPFAPLSQLRSQIEKRFGIQLKHRGEAHITVITPPEFRQLNTNTQREWSMSNLDQLAKQGYTDDNLTLQQTEFTVRCLGETQKRVDGELWRTFYVVVDSPGLTQFRSAAKQSAERHRLDPSLSSTFSVGAYAPHITVGFTHKDIHRCPEKSGKSCKSDTDKGVASCIADIEVTSAENL